MDARYLVDEGFIKSDETRSALAAFESAGDEYNKLVNELNESFMQGLSGSIAVPEILMRLSSLIAASTQLSQKTVQLQGRALAERLDSIDHRITAMERFIHSQNEES